MKKAFIAIIAVCAMAFGLTACGSPELKKDRAQVKSVDMTGDSLRSMIVTIGQDTKKVSLSDARFQNGIVLQGDSIILDYIDSNDNTLRALVVTVLPRPAHYFEPSDTLITVDSKAPSDSIQ